MKKINFNDFDVVIIQKQTAFERYKKYITDTEAHNTHVESRKILLNSLDELKMTYVLLNLDELKQSRLNFFAENSEHTGIYTKQKLVISLGGDGTLLHASHHVGGSVKLLGINSCPKNSVGHLCAAEPQDIKKILQEILIDKKECTKTVKRLRVKVETNYNIPLALNDILISNHHPAATSRYQISILDKQMRVLQCEKQLSSGLWIATAAGSTAAIASYGFPPEPISSHKIFSASRELYVAKGEVSQLGKFILDGQTQSLSIFSRMRHGLVCLDGSDFSVQFGFGETIEISSPDSASLLLVQRP